MVEEEERLTVVVVVVVEEDEGLTVVVVEGERERERGGGLMLREWEERVTNFNLNHIFLPVTHISGYLVPFFFSEIKI